MQFPSIEFIVGSVSMIGGATLALNKIGLLHFGKRNGDGKAAAKESAGTCPDPACKPELIKQIDRIDLTIRQEVFPRLNSVAQDVSFIRGRLEGLPDR